MKQVLITGSSTGIGFSAAVKLAEQFHVYAGVRKAADGEALKKESKHITPIILDVVDQASIAAAFSKISIETGEAGLYALVNNAGIVVPGPLEAIPIDDLRTQFEVNVIGLVAVTQTFLPLLRKATKTKDRDFARVINVGSIAGRMTIPFIGAYSASKFAVEAISDAFRRELAPQKVKVALIEPGAIQTPIWGKSAKTAGAIREKTNAAVDSLYKERVQKFEATVQKTAAQALPVERVVEAISDAVLNKKPKTRYLVGNEARAQAFMAHMLSDRALDYILAKMV